MGALVGLLLLRGGGASASEGGQGTGSIRIVATDEGYRYPDSIPGGPSHIVFENRGSDIHEVMFIKLPTGMSGAAYLQAARDGVVKEIEIAE